MEPCNWNEDEKAGFPFGYHLKAEEDFEQLKTRKKEAITYSLFDNGVDEINSFSYYDIDPATHEIVPKPLKEYPPVDYWEVQKYE